MDAKEYLKQLDIIKEGHSEFWVHWENRDSVELTKIMEAYARHYCKEIQLSDKEMEKIIQKGHPIDWPVREGAIKAYRELILKRNGEQNK